MGAVRSDLSRVLVGCLVRDHSVTTRLTPDEMARPAFKSGQENVHSLGLSVSSQVRLCFSYRLVSPSTGEIPRVRGVFAECRRALKGIRP